jgi:5S rRNA maturation endonuclease (ribonuclease M5)
MAFKEKILTMLQTLPADRKIEDRGSSVWLICPNPQHAGANEKTPSFRISLEDSYTGCHYCFGCGIHGSWKKTCEALGFSGPAKFAKEEFSSTSFSEEEEAFLFGKKEASSEFREVWPRNLNWRKIPGSLIQDVGGSLLVGSNTKEPLLRLPVKIYNEERGWIDCKINPSKDEKIKYQNKKGTWAKDVLFPYDYVRKMDNSLLILVEGPRDALVTIRNGFPALATLGSTSWSNKCINLIMSFAPKILVLMFDPDDAGEKLRKKVSEDFRDKIPVVPIRLESKLEFFNSKQKRVKLVDPADLTASRLLKILKKANVI